MCVCRCTDVYVCMRVCVCMSVCVNVRMCACNALFCIVSYCNVM